MEEQRFELGCHLVDGGKITLENIVTWGKR